MEKIIANPYFLGAFGATSALGLLVLGITFVLFRFLRKRIAEDILGMPAPGGPDADAWPYRGATGRCPIPCAEHKSVMERIGYLDNELDDVEVRQKDLREDTLPDKYVTRREHESCKKDRQSHEGELFSRVGALERKGGGV